MINRIIRLFKEFILFIRDLFKSRYIIWQLTKRDFKNKYLGTMFGLPWAFVQPSVFVFVIWFVFTYGFRSANLGDNVPFFLWFVCGYIPWLFISESIIAGTNSILEYSYLLKKVTIRASIIPIIKVLTALIIHCFFIFFIIIITVLYGIISYIYWVQVLYYLFCSIFLVIGISFLTSSIMVFFRDIGQVVNVFIQVLFWGTPILWDIDMLSGNILLLFKLNPFFYIIQGYRDSYIFKIWFWEKPLLTIYFWCFASLCFFIGAVVFKKVRPHFGDVL
jgi:ABC-type polysaccharide/polyol phosphate export permease